MRLADLLPLLHFNKDKIIHLWIYDKNLESFFKDKDIQQEVFLKQDATKVYDYICNSISCHCEDQGNHFTGEIISFSSYKLGLSDLFILCDTLRKHMLLFVLTIPGSGLIALEELFVIFTDIMNAILKKWEEKRVLQHDEIPMVMTPSLCVKISECDERITFFLQDSERNHNILDVAEKLFSLSQELEISEYSHKEELSHTLKDLSNIIVEQSDDFVSNTSLDLLLECLGCDLVTLSKSTQESDYLLSSVKNTIEQIKNSLD